MELRKYRAVDYENIIKLFYDTVHSVCSKDYSDVQLNAWAPNDKTLFDLENRLIINYTVVVEKDDVIIGFGNVNGTNYFDCLYTHKNYQGMGVATLIANDIEQYFYNKGIRIITTDASISAKPFFEKRGYVVLQEQNVKCRNQYLKNYKMQKILGENFYHENQRRIL